jgi:hypothetical protein
VRAGRGCCLLGFACLLRVDAELFPAVPKRPFGTTHERLGDVLRNFTTDAALLIDRHQLSELLFGGVAECRAFDERAASAAVAVDKAFRPGTLAAYVSTSVKTVWARRSGVLTARWREQPLPPRITFVAITSST